MLEQERDFTAQSMAARDYLAHRAPPDVRANAVFADSIRIDRDLYRTCAPRRTVHRAFCLYVNTDQDPPGVKVDTNAAPNAEFAGRRTGPGTDGRLRGRGPERCCRMNGGRLRRGGSDERSRPCGRPAGTRVPTLP